MTGGQAAALRLLDDHELGPELDRFEPTAPPMYDDLGRLRLSFSRIDTYRRCPAEFRFSYIDRIPGEPAPALSFGTSIHTALERFYDRKLPTPPSVDELLGFLYDAWDTAGFREVDRDEQLAYYRFAQDVLRRFHRREAPTYRLPADVERWFELPFEGVAVIVGSIDRVDVDPETGELEVIDYKTSKRVRDREKVRGSLQLAIYALACEHLYGQLPAAVTLDFVVAGVRVSVPTHEIDLDGARRTVRDTVAAIRDGRYDPQPNHLCGWCDFRSLCPAWEGEGPDVLGHAVQHLDRLKRSLTRDVRTLRELEAGVARLRTGPDTHASDEEGSPRDE
ncbi:MAG: PD-(D/E)XK nuclease family protein [Actinobacteria bacterium]|nr:PD-(D/E)XK nuclease family protein [Actinomycetota bacterium]